MISREEELQVYRNFITTIYICRNITLDSDKISNLLAASDNYIRSADFQAQSDEEYEEYRDKAFHNLRDETFG